MLARRWWSPGVVDRRLMRMAAALAAAIVCVTPGSGAEAAKRRQKAPPPPPPGFVVEATRIEGQTPDVTFTVEGVGEYRGAIELRRSGTTHGPIAAVAPGKPAPKSPPQVAGAGVGVVNDVGFEDYLKGIAEVPSRWPAEALRAQAVAARTYALYILSTGSAGSAAGLGAQICASEGCQVYAGLAKERSPGGANWAAAVDATQGQALVHGGKPILAKYSSSNGGVSVDGGRPYLKALPDPDDTHSPLHRWALTLSYDDLGRALAAPGPVVDVRRDGSAVVAVWRGPDGGGGGEVRATPAQFRAKVNAAVAPPGGRARTVPSPMFNVRADNGARVLTVEGRGYGHGIGMGQYGAYGKALRGMKAPGILAAYYPGAKLVALPPEQRPASVRVALDPGRPEVRLSASGTFRVYDEKANLLASVGSGTWRAVPGGNTGIRLIPPPGQLDVPRVTGVRIEPPSPLPGQEVTIAFRTTVPAYVRAVARPPGGADVEVVPSRPAGAEEVVAKLPAATGPGAYVVSIGVDAGGGRTAAQMLIPVVLTPPGGPKRVWTPEGPKAVSALAAESVRTMAAAKKAAVKGDGGGSGWMVPAGLVAVGLGGTLVARRRRRRSLVAFVRYFRRNPRAPKR